jgi:phosphatidate cytidylyltransferase
MKLGSLHLRILSAAILAPLTLWCIVYGGVPFLAMVVLALGVSFKEWAGMARLAPKPWVDGIAGIVYIALCFAAFVCLRLYHGDQGTGFALCLLLCVWATDIGAYFAGKAIGGPKMAPAISPNKTWAGLMGGILSSIAVFFAYIHYIGPFLGELICSDLNLRESFSPPSIFILGLVIAISDQIGDLLISRQKRKVGVKDTGTLIPGHGGILDRIDGLLLSAPVFVAALKVLGL